MKPTKPHLATDCDLTKLNFPVWAFRKVDGCRAINLEGTTTGRSLKPHANLHFTATYSKPEFLGFDGEVTFGNIRGDSLCRDTTSVLNRIQGEPEVEWHLFDWLHPEVLDLPYSERYSKLLAYYQANENWLGAHNVFIIPHHVLNTVEEVEAYYQESVDMGFEGAVLRSPLSMHKSGRCTVKEGAYLRLKPSSDKEARVVHLVEAMENQNEKVVNALGHSERSSHKENKVGKSMVGMLVCIDVESGIEIDVGAGKMTHEERTHFWNNQDELVGKLVKYRSMDSGVKDKPRFARFISVRAESDYSV